MSSIRWIIEDVVFAVHQSLLSEHGGSTGVRDKALLESALARPKQRVEYEPESSLFQLAAAYSFGLAKNHPFVDGNKRIALAIGAVFLEINGKTLNASEPETVIVFERLAAGELLEEELAAWFETNSIANKYKI